MRRLIVNARIPTGDPYRPWADAMLLQGNQVIALGTSAALKKRAPEALVIDAAGAELPPDGGAYRERESA